MTPAQPAIRTLKDNPSAKLIRDTKLAMLAEWEAENEQPGELSVKRGWDVLTDSNYAVIIVRPTLPGNMKWSVPE